MVQKILIEIMFKFVYYVMKNLQVGEIILSPYLKQEFVAMTAMTLK
jgi:hypothetical protein